MATVPTNPHLDLQDDDEMTDAVLDALVTFLKPYVDEFGKIEDAIHDLDHRIGLVEDANDGDHAG